MQTFKKTERLRNKNTIEQLFNQGQSFSIYPFKVIWIEIIPVNNPPAQLLIGVSKKNMRRAVDRNKMKRRIREAYRKNKGILYDYLNNKELNCALALLHSGNELSSFKEVEQKILSVLQRLIVEHENSIR